MQQFDLERFIVEKRYFVHVLRMTTTFTETFENYILKNFKSFV